MFFFNWFSGKHCRSRQASSPRSIEPVARAQAALPEDGNHDAKGKEKIGASREQLYEAIRESMTRLGILSSSYKFKVLSLDQQGSSYLVVLDLTRNAGDAVHQPAEMEALMVQNAIIRYQIAVCAVYWRINEVAAVSKPSSSFASAAPCLASQSLKKEALSYEPIEADEVAAFERALLAASAHSALPAAPEAIVKASRGLRHFVQPEDFEDTEVAELMAYPALSSTQYGNLY